MLKTYKGSIQKVSLICFFLKMKQPAYFFFMGKKKVVEIAGIAVICSCIKSINLLTNQVCNFADSAVV